MIIIIIIIVIKHLKHLEQYSYERYGDQRGIRVLKTAMILSKIALWRSSSPLI